MKISSFIHCLKPLALRPAVSFAFATLCGAMVLFAARGEDADTGTDFPYVIQPELGAAEFAPGDSIVISLLRGNRQHLEPGGRYMLEGTYTLSSADSADLAWYCTSRSNTGSTPVAKEQHMQINRGSGQFHLEKTLLDDGWLHVSFYAGGKSHGGIYFGEEGLENTVLRKKGWSDFPANTPDPGLNRSTPANASKAQAPDRGNAAIMAYLGDPVPAPAGLDSKYTASGLNAAFMSLMKKEGWDVVKLAVDDSEFPFLIYGVISGKHELPAKDMREIQGYDYCGSVRGSTGRGSTYFALNMTPRDQYPAGVAAACHRRLMVRMQMLADAVGQGE